jgi:hypothetical protein
MYFIILLSIIILGSIGCIYLNTIQNRIIRKNYLLKLRAARRSVRFNTGLKGSFYDLEV